uniref:Uncharacterized protein n=1 Tax=Glossina brevipalpis TaxID=37001 RepID=A0A1A9WWC5_9MUSC
MLESAAKKKPAQLKRHIINGYLLSVLIIISCCIHLYILLPKCFASDMILVNGSSTDGFKCAGNSYLKFHYKTARGNRPLEIISLFRYNVKFPNVTLNKELKIIY